MSISREKLERNITLHGQFCSIWRGNGNSSFRCGTSKFVRRKNDGSMETEKQKLHHRTTLSCWKNNTVHVASVTCCKRFGLNDRSSIPVMARIFNHHCVHTRPRSPQNPVSDAYKVGYVMPKSVSSLQSVDIL
jgi:hypothetical protein